MYIKKVYNVVNYKGLENNFSIDFKDTTYIIGDNAKCKSTAGSLPLWILTGYNAFGSNQEQVANDRLNIKNTVACMTFVDNDGNEHELLRCKGKENYVMLDGVRTTQEVLSKFYTDVHLFICAYSPTYFRSLKLAEQRELLLRIMPPIQPKDAFELLEKEEKEIIENPIIDIKGYCKEKRAEIKDCKSRLDQIVGSRDELIQIALQKEDEMKKFDKENELQNLKEEYQELFNKSSESIKLEDLKKDIEKIENKINSNVKENLKNLQEKYLKEKENLNNVESATSTCPTCKQEIRNENMIKALKRNYEKNLESVELSINNLKQETQELVSKRDLQKKRYELLSSPEAISISNKKEKINAKIDELEKEKSEILLYNKEVSLKHNQIMLAKSKLESYDKEKETLEFNINKKEKQIKIATRLNLLIMSEQMKSISDYLDNVTIEFSKVDESTGEIKDVYLVKYAGREYSKLSRSYKLRADIEISRLISKLLNVQSPIFIDDAESITEINMNLNSQIIISNVVKYNELEILYSYPDVLDRLKKSIEKNIENSCNNSRLLNVA